MDYEKKYKDAQKWIESIYTELSHEHQMEAESFFPELKESEDEMIIKEFCKDIWNYIPYEKAHKYIAWLEKQEGCEYIKKDWLEHIKQSWYKEGFIDGKYSGEKQGEKKHTDNDMVEALRTEYEKGKADAIAEMQKKWSEEDEDTLAAIIAIIRKQYNGTNIEEKKYYNVLINLLKSLKDRVQHQNMWKPSDEQMEALHDLNLTGNISYAGQGQVLIEFYNDLKKLKGE